MTSNDPIAASGYFVCAVTAAGPSEDGNIYIGLKTVTGPPFPKGEQWFTANQAFQGEMLAVALSALGRYEVVANLASTDELGVIRRLSISTVPL